MVRSSFATVALAKLFVKKCALNVDNKRNCSNDSSSVKPVCVTPEVNIVEEEQNVAKSQEKNKTSTRRRVQECLVVVLTASEIPYGCREFDHNDCC